MFKYKVHYLHLLLLLDVHDGVDQYVDSHAAVEDDRDVLLDHEGGDGRSDPGQAKDQGQQDDVAKSCKDLLLGALEDISLLMSNVGSNTSDSTIDDCNSNCWNCDGSHGINREEAGSYISIRIFSQVHFISSQSEAAIDDHNNTGNTISKQTIVDGSDSVFAKDIRIYSLVAKVTLQN